MPHTIFISDGVGSVELVDTFGDDLTVVNAARVSFAKESKEMTTADEKLINYLAKHHHVTPFFHPQIRLRIKMPIFVAREWFRHQIGLSRNEVSRRYVDFEPECWLPVDGLRARDPKLKQGSRPENIPDNDRVFAQIEDYTKDTIAFYKKLLADGVAPELARTVLPQSMYTEFIETGSLAAYARICGLRLDPTAQKEIREYAAIVSRLLEQAFPVSWKALSAGHPEVPVPQTAAPANGFVTITVPVPEITKEVEQHILNTIQAPVAPVQETVKTLNGVDLKLKSESKIEHWGC
jgi:thymidylate synthase (FAD)